MKKFYYNATNFLKIDKYVNSANYSTLKDIYITDFELAFLKAEIKDDKILAVFNEMVASMQGMLDSNRNAKNVIGHYGHKYEQIEASGKCYSLDAIPIITVTPIAQINERTYSRNLSVKSLKKLKDFSVLATQFLEEFVCPRKTVVFKARNVGWRTGTDKNISLSKIVEQLRIFLKEFKNHKMGQVLNINFDDFPYRELVIEQQLDNYRDETSKFYIIARSGDKEGFLSFAQTEHSSGDLYRYNLTKKIEGAALFHDIPPLLNYDIIGRLHLKISYDFVAEPNGDFAHEVDGYLQKHKFETSIAVPAANKKHKL